MIIRKYITKSELRDEDVKTQLALGYGNIPPETEVTFVEEWTNFYGNWVRVKYKGRIYTGGFKMNIEEKALLIEKLLKDLPTFTTVDFNEDEKEIYVYVDYRDWKHDHLRIVNLIKNTMNPKHIYEEVTNEDGSDCYSSKHIFCF